MSDFEYHCRGYDAVLTPMSSYSPRRICRPPARLGLLGAGPPWVADSKDSSSRSVDINQKSMSWKENIIRCMQPLSRIQVDDTSAVSVSWRDHRRTYGLKSGFYGATLCVSAVFAVALCLSVCPSVCHVDALYLDG